MKYQEKSNESSSFQLFCRIKLSRERCAGCLGRVRWFRRGLLYLKLERLKRRPEQIASGESFDADQLHSNASKPFPEKKGEKSSNWSLNWLSPFVDLQTRPNDVLFNESRGSSRNTLEIKVSWEFLLNYNQQLQKIQEINEKIKMWKLFPSNLVLIAMRGSREWDKLSRLFFIKNPSPSSPFQSFCHLQFFKIVLSNLCSQAENWISLKSEKLSFLYRWTRTLRMYRWYKSVAVH